MAKAIHFSEAEARLDSLMDTVCDDAEPLIITRDSARPVVLLSLDDYNATLETARLLRSPNNAKRLRESLEQANNGDAV